MHSSSRIISACKNANGSKHIAKDLDVLNAWNAFIKTFFGSCKTFKTRFFGEYNTYKKNFNHVSVKKLKPDIMISYKTLYFSVDKILTFSLY